MRRRVATAVGFVAAAGLLTLGLTARLSSDHESIVTGGAPATASTSPPSTTPATVASSSTTTGPTTTTTGKTTTTTGKTTTTLRKTTATTAKPVTTTTRPLSSTTTTTAPPAGLKRGASGPQVTLLQQRLSDLGYWLGPVDGAFGDGTVHAVIALQKVAGLPRTGVVDPATAAAVAEGRRATARTTTGRTVEIDLAHQVLLIVQDGHVEHIFDTSTGRPGLETPKGQFRIFNQIDTSDYHGQYRPKQFYAPRDLAVHGYSNVPTYPYSHGCARVTLRAMDWLWANGNIPVGTPVLIY
jgi:N-acetylmuramoyl-L-alanine amidase